MNIGFDLDKILISNPPLIPSWLMSKLYGEKANGSLSYRFPGKMEQVIRKMSHAPLLRKPLFNNIKLLVRMKKSRPQQKLFLISSRYSFLQTETENLVKRLQFKKIFNEMYFNFSNQQPHLFKESILKKNNVDKYVDDDLPLLEYLAKKFPKTTFYWLNNKVNRKLQKNIIAIIQLDSVFQ